MVPSTPLLPSENLAILTYGFTHVTSSPLYPQSNGLSERTVQTVKNVLQKCKESGQDPHLAMLCLRSTPLSLDLPSPAELLNGQVYQTNLPAVSKPSSSNGDVNVKLQLRRDKQKAQYDKTAKQPLQPLFAEDRVGIHNPANNRWEPGVVHCVADAPRSYMVANSTGGVLRRNRRHLRRTDEAFELPVPSKEVPEDIPIGDSHSKELVTSSSSASPDSVASSPAGETDPPPVAVPPPLRRSTRRV